MRIPRCLKIMGVGIAIYVASQYIPRHSAWQTQALSAYERRDAASFINAYYDGVDIIAGKLK